MIAVLKYLKEPIKTGKTFTSDPVERPKRGQEIYINCNTMEQVAQEVHLILKEGGMNLEWSISSKSVLGGSATRYI